MQKYKADNESLFRLWERYGQPKIALKVQDERVMVRTRQITACIAKLTALHPAAILLSSQWLTSYDWPPCQQS